MPRNPGHEKSLHDWLLAVLTGVVTALLAAAIIGGFKMVPIMYQTAVNVAWIKAQMAGYYSTKEANQTHAAINGRIDRNEAAVHDLDARVRNLEMDPHRDARTEGHP